MMMQFKVLGLWLAIACSFLLCSCQPQPSQQPPTMTLVHVATLTPNQKIPLPKTEILLTIDGQIENLNQGDTIVMDRSTIESLAVFNYTIFDPFEKKIKIFRGVKLTDLMALWHVKPTAKNLVLTALNDYQVTIPIEAVQKIPILVAIMENGEYMQRNYRGPAMLVVPANNYPLELSLNSYWIWQLNKITVE